MKLNSAQRAYVVYDMANAAYALIVRTVFAALLFKFCADEVWGEANTTAAWGYICSGAGIVAGGFSIVLGNFADRHTAKKRCLALMVAIGVLCTAGFCGVGKGMAYSVAALSFVSLCCYMSANSFYDALLLDVAPRARRDWLSSFSYACGYIGGVIPFIVCLILSFALGRERNELAMKLAFVVAALWWAALTVPLLMIVRERKKRPEKTAGVKLKASIAALLKNRNVLIFLAAYFLYIDGVGTIYTMAAPISSDIGISTNALLIIILALQFLAFPCTLLYGRLARRIAPRNLVLFAVGLYILTALLTLLLAALTSPGAKLGVFIAIAALIGTSQGGIQALSRSLFSRIVPPEHAAEFFGFYNIFGKFTTIVGPLLVGVAVAAGFRAEIGIGALAVPFALGGWLLTKVDFTPRRTAR